MKKLIMFFVAGFLVLMLAPAQLNAATGSDPVMDELKVPAEIGFMVGRLEEIRAMDVSLLAKSEKRELRKEVRSIEQSLNAYSGGGIYISVGAAILIVLLLILLL